MVAKRWLLDEECREELLALFVPYYPIVRADYAELGCYQPLGKQVSAEVVGQADAMGGCKALILSLGGFTIDAQGYTLHIVWSLSGKVQRTSCASLFSSWEPIPRNVPILLHAQI